MHFTERKKGECFLFKRLTENWGVNCLNPVPTFWSRNILMLLIQNRLNPLASLSGNEVFIHIIFLTATVCISLFLSSTGFLFCYWHFLFLSFPLPLSSSLSHYLIYVCLCHFYCLYLPLSMFRSFTQIATVFFFLIVWCLSIQLLLYHSAHIHVDGFLGFVNSRLTTVTHVYFPSLISLVWGFGLIELICGLLTSPLFCSHC